MRTPAIENLSQSLTYIVQRQNVSGPYLNQERDNNYLIYT